MKSLRLSVELFNCDFESSYGSEIGSGLLRQRTHWFCDRHRGWLDAYGLASRFAGLRAVGALIGTFPESHGVLNDRA
jgi:hypothetical protein